LWVNLIMDTMAALALATESPTEELLSRPPYGKNDPLITRTMWKMILGQAFYQLLVNFIVLYFGDIIFGVPKHSVVHYTLLFNIFVLCQLFNEINSRRIYDEPNVLEGIFSNFVFLGVMAFTVTMQFLIVRYGGEFSSTTPLSAKQWIACIIISALGVPWSMVLRKIKVQEPQEKKKTVSPASMRWRKVQDAARAMEVVRTLKRRSSLFDKLHGSNRKSRRAWQE